MRYYRRGEHNTKKASLTVDNVLCKVKPRGHLTVDGKWLCLHGMAIKFPTWDEDQITFRQI